MNEYILIGIAVIACLYGVSLYNNLTKKREYCANAFSQIDVQLKRRYELIPNLVETAKAFLSHEKETLEAVIAARNSAASCSNKLSSNKTDAKNMSALMGAEAMLSQSLGKFFALSEAYPDLKSNENMLELSEQLTHTENKISFARQAYNDSVTNYNVLVESFPSNLIANNFKFEKALLWELDDQRAREPVKVTF